MWPAVQAGIDLPPPPDIVDGTRVADLAVDRAGWPGDSLSYGDAAGKAHQANPQAWDALTVAPQPLPTREPPVVSAEDPPYRPRSEPELKPPDPDQPHGRVR